MGKVRKKSYPSNLGYREKDVFNQVHDKICEWLRYDFDSSKLIKTIHDNWLSKEIESSKLDKSKEKGGGFLFLNVNILRRRTE